jgi:hypothetical protein
VLVDLCPNVCSTTFARDAVYAMISSLGILDHSKLVDVFLNSNLNSLGAIVSMQPADLLEFRYCYSNKAAILWVLLLCTGGLFSGKGSYVVGLLLCTGGLFQWTRPP